MNQPLTGGGGGGDGDSVSQTSQSSRSRLSGSLLERIQAQRSREQQQGGSSSGFGGGSHNNNMSAPTPSQITIPTYGPGQHMAPPQRQQSTGEMNDFGVLSEGNGWSGVGNGSGMMMSSGMEGNTNGGVSSEALLGSSSNPQQREYSMGEYFKTFVMDVYNLFRSLPIWIQVPLLALLLFLVIKWI